MKPQQIIELEKHLGIELDELNVRHKPNMVNVIITRTTEGQSSGSYVFNDDDQTIIHLNLAYCTLKNVSLLTTLTNLTRLSLVGIKISDFSFLENLTGLTELNLEYNQITNIDSLKNLTNLTILSLEHNQITNIDSLQGLKNLATLDLRWNQITNFSLSFLNCFPKLEHLYLFDNPIDNILQETLNKNENVLKPVRDYLEGLEKGKTENKEVKIIFIGNGNVGKTQIVKRLCEQENFVFDTQHNSTDGIVLLRRDLAGFDLNCWDFAGQDIYHATHRLFMQTRALLVLVWDFENETNDFHEWKGKKYENEKLRYWLEYAQCFAPESPILVLQNKIDEPKGSLDIDIKDKYRQEYSIFGDFLEISAETGEGFMRLEEDLEEIFQTNKVFKTPDLPTNWVAVRNVIREKQEKTTEKTLSVTEFMAICQEKGCEKSVSTILGYLHDSGVLYYREGYFNDQIILNQDWAIQAIYKILQRANTYINEIVADKQKGNLYYKNLCKIWAENTDDERKLFIDFMLSAELVFETTEKGKYDFKERTFAVPSCLSSKKPNDVIYREQKNAKNAKNFKKTEISYRFLPKVFIQRLLVRANRFSEVRLMWQKGLLLRTAQGSAIVEACYEKEQQKITILAENDFLTKKIQEELAKIADEGKLRGKEGKSETLEEKFGLAGLQIINLQNLKTQAKQFFINDDLKQALETILQYAVNQVDIELEQECGFQLSRLNGLGKKRKNELPQNKIRKAIQDLIGKMNA